MYVDITVLIINFLYFVIELIGGFYFNSITLKADAFHMLTDILAISISIYCEYEVDDWTPAVPTNSLLMNRPPIVSPLLERISFIYFFWLETLT